jgi:hypothetical protein
MDVALDLLVMSIRNPQKEKVAAFEALIGSHGGMGNCQSYPCILYAFGGVGVMRKLLEPKISIHYIRLR